MNSTGIAAQLDPEDWRELVAEYHRVVAEEIERFGGYVAQYLGDGVMAYFGWPQAYDNNAELAARSALAILDAISKLNEHPTRPKLSARIGIDSGAVVVGASAGKNADVFGDTPNIAARAQAAALPGTVVATADTHRLISGLFVVEDRGTQTFKGIERPIPLYRLIRPSGVRGRLRARAPAGALTPFVGRDDELRLLMTRWERTLEGEGQIVLISGEAGIGKSRLVQRFHEQIAGRSYNWVEAAAGPFFQNSPFYPVTEILRQLPAQEGSEPSRGNAATLRQSSQGRPGLTSVRGSNGHPENGTPGRPVEQNERLAPSHELDQQLEFTPQLTAAFLDLLRPAEHPISPHQRRRLLSTLVERVLGAARVVPLVIAIEDLHWADPSTLELIQLLVEQGTRARLLLLCTARPEFRATWKPRTEITLSPLNAHNTRMMLEQVAGQKPLPEETVTTVVERTGGVPLFIEELTRAVLESGAGKPTQREIPVTLHGSLMARLDRLGPAREVLQIGAVIGNDFSYELLQAVHPIAEQELQQALQSATDAELVYVHGIAPDATYQFKHALIRDAAYEALLRSRRKEVHSRIAEVLVKRFPDIVTSAPEHVAHHYTEASLIEQAIPYWQVAGQRASQRSANVEAIAHLSKGLKLLKILPDTPERAGQELALQIALGPPLIATRGYAALEVEQTYTRARELCQRSEDTVELFPVLVGLHRFYLARAELQIARQLGEHCLTLAQHAQDPMLLEEGHRAIGTTLYRLGEFVPAQVHLERGIALHDPQRYHSVASYALDSGVLCLIYGAWALWFRGYPDRALQLSHKALTLAQELSHPLSLAPALICAAWLHQLRGERQAVEDRAEEVIALSTEHGFPLYLAQGTIRRGWALTARGQIQDGISQIRQGMAAHQATGANVMVMSLLALLADVYRAIGEAGRGLAALIDAFAQVEKTGERWYEAELYRLKGELLLGQKDQKGKTEEVEKCFLKALAVARDQQAKSLELRAATSFAHLWHREGKQKEAHKLLAEIYNWFTEGFDTADLTDAKALLKELNG